MQVGVIGVNHKSAPLPLREAFALACARRFGGELPLHGAITYLLLTTCNRIELYFSSDDLASTHTYFLHLLRQELKCEFEHMVYSYFGYECFFHLACVAAGVDSAIVGETEIQGQVRRAYELASTTRPLSKAIHFMFQKCLKISKNIRHSRALFPSRKTLEEAVFRESTNRFPEINKASILFVGDSHVNRKIFSYFKRRDLNNIHLCNRSNESARKASQEEKIGFLPWEHRFLWSLFDIVILGTKSPEYLITTAQISNVFHKVLIIDLSLPRNADPRIAKHSEISLLNIDDLHKDFRKSSQQNEKLSHIKHPLISEAVRRQILLFEKKEEMTQLVFA